MEEGLSGPFDRWPLGRGFDRFYGFLGAETDQFDPDLVYDNHSIEPIKESGKPYHLTEDLTDKAIGFLRDLRVVDETKPFFLYYCPGANHAPHQVPEDWADKYRASSTPVGMPTASRSTSASSSWASYRPEPSFRRDPIGSRPGIA